MTLVTLTRSALAGQSGLTLDVLSSRQRLPIETGISLSEGATGIFSGTSPTALGGTLYILEIRNSGGNLLETIVYRANSQASSGVDIANSEQSDGGYEFTAGFSDRTTGAAGASEVGSNVLYTQGMVNSDQWLRFGFDAAQQNTNDLAYWTEPAPAPTAGVGLFGGSYMPAGVTSMFDFGFSASTFSDAGSTSEGESYTQANGSFDFSQCEAGDLALIRFDFNVLPQVANTTLEVALIWQTRLSDGTPTFSFALTGDPMFYGTGTVGRTFLARPMISAYFASQEDVNARALLAIRADNPVQIQPLTTLTTIQR